VPVRNAHFQHPCPVCRSLFEVLQFEQVNTCFFFPHVFPLSLPSPFFPVRLSELKHVKEEGAERWISR